jgi:hypothetical protein
MTFGHRLSQLLRLAPLLTVAVLAGGTALQVGCSSAPETDNANGEDLSEDGPGHGYTGYGYGYGYGHGYGSYGYGSYGSYGYGYGSYGYGDDTGN